MGGATNRFFALLSTTTTTTTTATAPLPFLLLHRGRHSSLLLRSHSQRRLPSLPLVLLHSPTPRHFLTPPHSSSARHLHYHATPSSLHDNFPDPASAAGTGISCPEWSNLVDALSAAGYFSRTQGFPSEEDELVRVGDLPDEFVRAARACLDFARERASLIRLLSRRDVEVVIGNGTPFLFKDANDSVRKLRSFVSSGESNVLDIDKVSTVDLMRFILSYVSNLVFPSESNNIYNRELVESSIRNLLRELAKLCSIVPNSNAVSSVQRQFTDGNGQSLRPFGQNIEMKRGDWICARCNFMNFARNMKCLECEEARPRRQLTGGEWECPQCDFFNYGRNMVCLRCDCKRPGEVSVNNINTRSRMAHESESNPNKAEIDSRLAANEEKAQRWFSKISQLDSTSDISSAIADEDFPEIMPLRKGVNRFVVSTRKTPLERRLANSRYQSNLDGPSSISSSNPQYGQPQGRNSNYVPFVPLPSDMFAKKPENSKPEDKRKEVAGGNEFVAPNRREWSDNFTGSYGSIKSEESVQKPLDHAENNKEKEEAEKSERWFRKVAELHNVTDLASEISDEDFPEIMPIRKGENRFVVSKKKDRSLTSPAYKRQMAMEQASNTKFVPFVPFPPDYFAKKDKPEAADTALSNKDAGETNPNPKLAGRVQEKLDNARSGELDNARSGELNKDHFQQIESHVGMESWNSEPSRDNLSENKIDGTYRTPANGNFAQSSAKAYSRSNDGLGSGNFSKETSNRHLDSTRSSLQSNNQNHGEGWTGKSLEGSAVKELDPLDMSEEAKAERWFRRVAQIKDISELSQIPDEDFPSIMPMRKGVNRFVVSKRKTPLERRLTSPQYRRNLPIVSSDPVKKESDNS
ncbi:zinc finger protein [Parasponia andersonii]|uniref:Zinc finger protein n=1 Tax=Parasponia andersonii TaxID=3476 RepID=A0A2P5BQ31_PARAD|nr:zinc finger protein [Parasponia andersonii]